MFWKLLNVYIDYLKRVDGDVIRENLVNWNDQIDEIVFYYSDFVALQVMGIVSIYNFYIFNINI